MTRIPKITIKDKVTKTQIKDIRSVNKKGVNYASFVLKASANNSLIVGIEAGSTKTKGLNMHLIRKAHTVFRK